MLKKLIALVLLLGVLIGGYIGWRLLMAPNITAKRVTVKIPTGSSYEDVLEILYNNNVVKDHWGFETVAKFKDYGKKINSGNYVFTQNMNNRQIVNMLKFGWQTPVKLVVYNIRTKEEFAGLVGRTLEIDSTKMLAQLNDPAFAKEYGLDTNKILSRFIVDNYEFYWNVSMEKFLEKMKGAYESYWNESRRAKADALNMSIADVTTLASITEKEVIFDKELPTVAGVYLNRIKIGMPLQADPTLVFGTRDFDAKRVTNVHKDFDSPYNTYKYAGLPPGQICMPRKKSIDAVLNHDEHQYVYFCANPDMSGYSIFSKTYEEQMRVAAQYRKKMDKMNIH